MLELYVVSETARTLQQFKGEKCKVGVKPLLSFSGGLFESPVTNQYTLAKSMFVDFFRGGETQTVDVEGLQLLISFFAGEEEKEEDMPKIQMRCWRIVTKRSGHKVPRVEVEEMGPRIDFRLGRTKEADEGVWKEAMKKGKRTEVCWPGSWLLMMILNARLLHSQKSRKTWRPTLWAIRWGEFI